MSTHYNNVAQAVSGTPGTGTITLGSAVTGAQTLGAAAGGNATVDVFITDGSAWEVARNCTYTHSGTTLTRGTLEASSTGSVLSLTSAAVVRVAMPASTGNLLEQQLDRSTVFARSPSTGTQTFTDGVFTKVSRNTNEVTDTKGWYDASTNHRFTPLRAGAYLIFGGVQVSVPTSTIGQLAIYKNGSAEIYGGVWNQSSAMLCTASGVVSMNGSTDYIELYMYTTPSVTTVEGAGRTYFKAIFLGD